jgi:hypothetical protein
MCHACAFIAKVYVGLKGEYFVYVCTIFHRKKKKYTMLGLHILDQWLEIRAETFRFGRYCTDGNGL